MIDIQATPDTREVPLQKVGVKNVRYPLQVLDKNRKSGAPWGITFSVLPSLGPAD